MMDEPTQKEQQSATTPKHAGGRPTLYKEEYCEQLITHFATDHAREVEEVHTNQKGDTWSISKEQANSLPTFESFAVKLGVCVDTLMDWTRANPEFFRAYARAKAAQKAMLLDNGLKGLYNPLFARFVAVSCCGMKPESKIELGDEIGEIVISIKSRDAGNADKAG